MKITTTLLLFACLLANTTLSASASARGFLNKTEAVPADKLSTEQMDNLLAPIALYPDPLLAQVFPASTFVDQVELAARWLRGNNNQSTGVDSQSWDVSVKSVAHYPQVIYMMSDKLDWTTALGQAYVNQSTDVLTSVQRLRARAKAAGHLVSTPQQTVIVEKEVIKVVPAQAQVIYVPTYNPQVVYVESGPSTGEVVAAAAISFGVGLAIGAWLNNDCNWHTHTVYYHGWHGSGWISTSYSHVHVNSIYVNRSYTNVNVNRTVVNRNVNYNNINHYNNVNRSVNYNNVNRNNVNVNNVNLNYVNRNNVNTNNVNRNNVNNANVQRNINTNNQNINQYRGQANSANATRPTTRATGQAMPQQSGFGGYGNAAATRSASERGQASRATAGQSRVDRSSGGTRGGRRH
jgi:hypothetical protein